MKFGPPLEHNSAIVGFAVGAVQPGYGIPGLFKRWFEPAFGKLVGQCQQEDDQGLLIVGATASMSRQVLSDPSGSLSMQYLLAKSSADGTASGLRVFSSTISTSLPVKLTVAFDKRRTNGIRSIHLFSSGGHHPMTVTGILRGH